MNLVHQSGNNFRFIASLRAYINLIQSKKLSMFYCFLYCRSCSVVTICRLSHSEELMMKIAVPKHNRLPLTLTTEGLGASHVIISTRRHENFLQTNGMTLCHLQNLQCKVLSTKTQPGSPAGGEQKLY